MSLCQKKTKKKCSDPVSADPHAPLSESREAPPFACARSPSCHRRRDQSLGDSKNTVRVYGLDIPRFEESRNN